MKKLVANITYKSILKGIKDIDLRNEVFNALDPQSQRLEIAWDSLQLVLADVIQPSDGCYWSDALQSVSGDSKTLQRRLIDDLPTIADCEVCQRGAIMLSQIRLGNSISSNDWDRTKGSPHNLKGFMYSDLADMEDEYEINKFNHPYATNTKEKMANILCNVLVNGNFNKHDERDYLIYEQK